MELHSEEHDTCESADRPECTMFEIAYIRKSALIHEVNCHRSYEECSDWETERDDEEIIRKCEGTDHTIETEGCVEYFEIEKSSNTLFHDMFCRLRSLLSEEWGESFREYIRNNTPYSRHDEFIFFYCFEECRRKEEEQYGESDFYCFYLSESRKRSFDPPEPVVRLIDIDKKVQKYHHEKCTTECCYLVVDCGKCRWVCVWTIDRHSEDFEIPESGRDTHDEYRKYKPHPKDSNRESEDEECSPPPGIPVLEYFRVYDRVIEWEWSFEYREYRDDRYTSHPIEPIATDEGKSEKEERARKVRAERFHRVRKMESIVWNLSRKSKESRYELKNISFYVYSPLHFFIMKSSRARSTMFSFDMETQIGGKSEQIIQYISRPTKCTEDGRIYNQR